MKDTKKLILCEISKKVHWLGQTASRYVVRINGTFLVYFFDYYRYLSISATYFKLRRQKGGRNLHFYYKARSNQGLKCDY